MEAVAVDARPVFRGLRVSDIPFVKNSWTQSYARYATFTEGEEPRAIKGEGPSRVHAHVYIPEQHALIERIMQRAGAVVVVACNAADQDQICGYLVAEHKGTQPFSRPAIHYLYVKELFRMQGLARSLLREAAQVLGEGPYWATHWCKLYPSKRGPTYPFDYNPFRIEAL